MPSVGGERRAVGSRLARNVTRECTRNQVRQAAMRSGALSGGARVEAMCRCLGVAARTGVIASEPRQGVRVASLSYSAKTRIPSARPEPTVQYACMLLR